MSDASAQPPGWYYAQGDPPGTQRYWDGTSWQGGPQPVAGAGGVAGYGAQAKLADGGSRIVAWFIDALILLIPLGIVGVVIGGTNQSGFGFDARQWISGIVTTLMWMGYHIFLNKDGGATPGRKVAKTKIVGASGEGATQEELIKRFGFGLLGIIPVVGGLILFFAGLASLVMIFVDENNQAAWDKFPGTKTVSTS